MKFPFCLKRRKANSRWHFNKAEEEIAHFQQQSLFGAAAFLHLSPGCARVNEMLQNDLHYETYSNWENKDVLPLSVNWVHQLMSSVAWTTLEHMKIFLNRHIASFAASFWLTQSLTRLPIRFISSGINFYSFSPAQFCFFLLQISVHLYSVLSFFSFLIHNFYTLMFTQVWMW